MRINEHPFLRAGDIVVCPECRERNLKIRGEIPNGRRLVTSDLEPINGHPALVAGHPLICFKCKAALTQPTRADKSGYTSEFSFIEIERNTQQAYPSGDAKNGMVKAGSTDLVLQQDAEIGRPVPSRSSK